MTSKDPLPLTELPTATNGPSDGLPTKKLPISDEPAAASAAASTPAETEPPLILGVEYDILIKFLKLFRDHYRKCEKATTFLEHRTDIPNIASIANQRDAVSHFKSALQPGVSRETRLQQYATAEEHFRRAIIEPYETALRKKIDELLPVLDQYRQEVLPVKERFPELAKFPSGEELDATFREIARRRDGARDAKGKNMWDEEWEQGVEDYVVGFDLAHGIVFRLQNAVYKLQQIRTDEEQQGKIAELQKQIEEHEATIAELRKAKGDESGPE